MLLYHKEAKTAADNWGVEKCVKAVKKRREDKKNLPEAFLFVLVLNRKSLLQGMGPRGPFWSRDNATHGQSGCPWTWPAEV